MSAPTPALRVLKMLGARGRTAARIAQLRCGAGHLLVTLLQAPQGGFLVAWPERKMPRPHSVARRAGVTTPADRPGSPPRVELFVPEHLDALHQAYGTPSRDAFCACTAAAGGVRIPLDYLAEIAAGGLKQGVVIADPQRVVPTRQV